MKTLSKIFLLFIILFSSQLHADEHADDYIYSADVKGMVCAFCAYSVSKNISNLPGVDADSVDVDLKGGHVQFRSDKVVDEKKLIALFSESGFSISNLKQTSPSTIQNKTPSKPALVIDVNPKQADRFNDIFESIGNIAANTPSHLLISAPSDYEDADIEDMLLKPLLMGRQQVIKVRFINDKTPANQSNTIRIQVFIDE